MTQVRQNVGDVEDGIVVILTDADIDCRAVVFADGTVQSKRDGDPLPLLDAAVVVCLQIACAVVFIDGVLL